jgi:pyruvate dehydrogenase E2 component (dihydrolipoamide acetyltransferase)
MPIVIKMPALSPTMEEGTLARWLVKAGDTVKSGDIMAEIETDKATMEFEAVDEGVIASIDVVEGTEGVKVGTVIATLAGEDEAASAPPAPAPAEPAAPPAAAAPVAKAAAPEPAPAPAPAPAPVAKSDRIAATPLARRIAEAKGIDLSTIKGSGPNGRIVRADLEVADAADAAPVVAAASAAPAKAAAPATPAPAAPVPDFGIPFEAAKLNNVRKTIARRLTEAKQTIPHIYLTVDVQLDALLKLRAQLNAALESQGVKLSVNDLLIKALAKALVQVPKCNVSFAGDELRTFKRADISVAVAAPSGLITPIAVEGMKFHHPVHIGDEVSVYAKLMSVGRTSMVIDVETWRRPRTGDEREHVTQARFVFVAIDDDRRPRPVRPLSQDDAGGPADTKQGVERG